MGGRQGGRRGQPRSSLRPFDSAGRRDFRVQPQEIFAIFTNFVATTKHKSRKIAIVGADGTARMQFRRVAEREPLRDDMRVFTDIREARVWLQDSAG